MKRAVRFKLHIDHIDNVDKDVWAVSYPGHYITAHRLYLTGYFFHMEGVPVRTRQPRAFLKGRGVVEVERCKNGQTVVVITGG